MDDEDELYDDSLLFKRTLNPVLNMSAMSCSSKRSGRLSLAFRNSATLMTAPLLKDNFRMPCTVPRSKISADLPRVSQTALQKKVCELCGSHQMNCKDGDCKKLSTGVFHAKDVNQNSINCPSKRQKGQETGSQENQDAIQIRKSQQSVSVQLPSESNVFFSQDSFFSSSHPGLRSQKPSDVLKHKKHNSCLTKQTKASKSDERQSCNWNTYNSPSKLGTPWVIKRFKENGKRDEESQAVLIDYLVKERKAPRKKTKRSRKSSQDLSYIEGATTSEDDTEEEPLKTCPIYKRIPGTSFAVDALCHGVDSRLQAHFLTRFREENCIQYTKVPIYCTPVIASLMRQRWEFPEDVLRTLEFDTPRIIDGVKVTALDAHNEPGSAVILFQLPNNVNIVYVGNLRADFTLESHPAFWFPNFETDYLMVDTTECDPNVNCNLREEVELRVKIIVNAFVKKHRKSLVVVVSDGLMEKCLYTTLALDNQLKLYAHGKTAKTLTSINDPFLMELLTADRREARLHIIEHTSTTLDSLRLQLKVRVSEALVIKPRKDFKIFDVDALKPETSWNVTVLDIPVLDGTSFADIKRLVQFLQPKRLVSNVSPHRDPIQTTYFQQWLKLKDPVVQRVAYSRR